MAIEGIVPRGSRRKIRGDPKQTRKAFFRSKTTPTTPIPQSKDSETHGKKIEIFRTSTMHPKLELGNVDVLLQRATSLPTSAGMKSRTLPRMTTISECTANMVEACRTDLFRRLKQQQPEQQCQMDAATVEITGNPQQLGDDKNIILFDWDDTLFPTTWVYDVVKPEMDNRDCNDVGANLSPYQQKQQPKTEPFSQELATLAKDLVAVLRAASEVAHVAIVSLSKRPWVEDSAAKYLPTVDFPALFDELGISVYYAREHVSEQTICHADEELGVDPFEVAKRFAMNACLQHLSTSGRGGCKSRFNILSVGDSDAERSAAMELRWSLPQLQGQRCFCKTVKLLESPTLEQLSGQLQALRPWLCKMLAHDEDFDFDLE
eukprot:CAMPEP_0172831972 /NCGR_PEP_ID=MMETSP1075-20121228/23342_1 /TAXON_ID=2916 /ORGANISM="Ceratium fusus, Strain PA161109" /LENGTH=375 /DNA_ID=CAMNT_0013674511 /DNA_START=12 /DNA_END=1139 /DNA_ORIENTATION=-